VKGVGYAYQMDNVTLTWLTNSFISGARLYWEDFENKISFFGVKGVPIPVAVSVFPDGLLRFVTSCCVLAVCVGSGKF